MIRAPTLRRYTPALAAQCLLPDAPKLGKDNFSPPISSISFFSYQLSTRNAVTTDCNANDNGNAGCGVTSKDANSYGPNFNNNGGGWYAMERTSTYINVWFWPRNSGSVPAAVKNGASTADSSTFGTPFANFVNTQCDIPSHFGSHHIIINLTLCE